MGIYRYIEWNEQNEIKVENQARIYSSIHIIFYSIIIQYIYISILLLFNVK